MEPVGVNQIVLRFNGSLIERIAMLALLDHIKNLIEMLLAQKYRTKVMRTSLKIRKF